MMPLWRKFARDRRGVFALIFAICLLPLVLMVALSLDYAFYCQARAQSALATDAAATHAVRAAAGTYTYELQNGASTATAISIANAAGKTAGAAWFKAQLANMPTASVPYSAGNPLVVVNQNTATGTGFAATVSFTGTYPPFFRKLFNNQNWNLNQNAAAQSAYNYVEILMLLDSSGSMLIGAEPSDVVTLEENTVCPPNTINPSGMVGWGDYVQNSHDIAELIPPSNGTAPANWKYTPGTAIAGTSGPVQYNPGTCLSGYNGAGYPGMPCAFACHTTNTAMPNYPAYTNDFFGIARQSGVTLRLDVLLSAVQTMINDMQSDEQVANQFSLGIYQFNTDASPIWQGSSNGQPTEASTDIADAAALFNSSNANYVGNPNASVNMLRLFPSGFVNDTFFPRSMNDLITGKTLNGTGTSFGPALGDSGDRSTPPRRKRS